MNAKWYAIRTKPGAQRTVPGERLISFIERDMEQEGFECYMPAYLYEAKHHRTKLWMLKRYPLFTGYAFVHLQPRQSLDNVRRVEGVMCILKPHRHLPPIEFKPSDMNQIMAIAHEVDGIFQERRASRIRWEDKMSRKVSRRDVENAFPPNSTAMIVEGAPFGGMLARVLGPSSKGKVKAVIELLNSFTSIDIPIENLREAS